MPSIRNLSLAICAYISLARGQTNCPSDVPFHLKASYVGMYLALASPCGAEQQPCPAFFNTSYSGGFEYTIPNGTEYLTVAKAPGSHGDVGLYADAGYGEHEFCAPITFSTVPPSNLNCNVVQSSDGDGTCDLECKGRTHIRGSNHALGVDKNNSNQFFLGNGCRYDTPHRTPIKVEYPPQGIIL